LKGNTEARLEAMATQTGANAQHMGAKYGFASCTSDYREVLDNPKVDAVMILTPHSVHAKMVEAALSAGKHVYVEKPLCIDREELESIKTAYESTGGELHLLVGYNRRFSPHAARMADVLAGRRDPMVVSYRINAGYVPPDHWVHSEEEGGSRVIGEVCHFIDMLQFLTNSDPTRIFAQRFSGGGRTSIASDNLVLQIKMLDGSLGAVVYSASGDRALPRERIEVFTEGRSLVLDDYRRLECYIQGKKKVHKSSSQQMGYKEELDHFIQMVQGRALPRLTPREAFLSTLATFAINESLESGRPVDL
jgi:polar amino acid transport system substrate-binding protein